MYSWLRYSQPWHHGPQRTADSSSTAGGPWTNSWIIWFWHDSFLPWAFLIEKSTRRLTIKSNSLLTSFDVRGASSPLVLAHCTNLKVRRLFPLKPNDNETGEAWHAEGLCLSSEYLLWWDGWLLKEPSLTKRLSMLEGGDIVSWRRYWNARDLRRNYIKWSPSFFALTSRNRWHPGVHLNFSGSI